MQLFLNCIMGNLNIYTIFIVPLLANYQVCMGFHSRYNNIGIKHDFLYINICWVPRVALKPEQEN